jgi:hypothetical protein
MEVRFLLMTALLGHNRRLMQINNGQVLLTAMAFLLQVAKRTWDVSIRIPAMQEVPGTTPRVRRPRLVFL